MADKLSGIFISEILADNAGGQAVDVDGDGNTNKADEFIELQNTTGSDVSLAGFELWSDQEGQLFSFGAGDIISPGGTATVLGNYSGTPPTGFFDAGLPENGNFLQDGEGNKYDTIYLVDTNTGEFIAFSYGNPPRTPNPPSNFPGTTQIGAGEAIDSSAPNGTAFTRDANGDLIESTPTPGTPDIPCFVSDCLIETDQGPIAAGNITPGMQVLTLDAGFQPVCAIRSAMVSQRDLVMHPELRPIVFPSATDPDLIVSPSHRIYLNCDAAQLLFGMSQVLAPANAFTGFAGTYGDAPEAPVTYVHLLFDKHQIIRANGIWTESLFLGDVVTPSLAKLTGWQVAPNFDLARATHCATARPVLRGFETRLLLAGDGPAHYAA